jgi:hypothetical protein
MAEPLETQAPPGSEDPEGAMRVTCLRGQRRLTVWLTAVTPAVSASETRSV